MLVGSRLLYEYDLLSPARKAKYQNSTPDWDYISPYKRNNDLNLEFLDELENRSVYILLHQLVDKYTQKGLNKKDVSGVMMLTLKISHMHYNLKNNSWYKHLHDIQYLFSLGYEPDEEYLLLLKNEWTKFYKGKEKINLNKKPEDFFIADCNQSHDELHLHFMFGSEPIYKKILRDGSEVAIDFNKFTNLSEQEKLYSVIEESMVIAYERNLTLLNGFKHLYTKLSKGWWNDYITLNFKEVIKNIEEHFQTFKLKSKQLTN